MKKYFLVVFWKGLKKNYNNCDDGLALGIAEGLVQHCKSWNRYAMIWRAY